MSYKGVGFRKATFSVYPSHKRRKNKRTREGMLNLTTSSVAGPSGTQGQ